MHHHEPSRDVRTRLECEGSETRRTAPSLCGGGVDSRAIVLKSRLSFLKPGQGTVHIFCEHFSLGDELGCHPKPKYLRQVERNPCDAGATIWRTTALVNDIRARVSSLPSRYTIEKKRLAEDWFYVERAIRRAYSTNPILRALPFRIVSQYLKQLRSKTQAEVGLAEQLKIKLLERTASLRTRQP